MREAEPEHKVDLYPFIVKGYYFRDEDLCVEDDATEGLFQIRQPRQEPLVLAS